MAKWVKPTVDTQYQIDFDWWQERGRNFRVHLLSHLCDECQERYSDYRDAELIDWIGALIAAGIPHKQVGQQIPFLGTLLKKPEDIERIEGGGSQAPRGRSRGLWC